MSGVLAFLPCLPPADTPPAILARLRQEIAAILESPDAGIKPE